MRIFVGQNHTLMGLEGLARKHNLHVDRFFKWLQIVQLLHLVDVLVVVGVGEHARGIQLHKDVPRQIVSQISQHKCAPLGLHNRRTAEAEVIKRAVNVNAAVLVVHNSRRWKYLAIGLV